MYHYIFFKTEAEAKSWQQKHCQGIIFNNLHRSRSKAHYQDCVYRAWKEGNMAAVIGDYVISWSD